MQVPAGLYVNKTDNGAIANVTEVRARRIIFILVASRIEVPVVIGILMVVAGNLLLS